MLRLATAAVLSATLTTATWAQSVAPVDTLFRSLGLDEIIAVMREEGLDHGTAIQADLFTGQGGSRWAATVSDIYDTERMAATVRNRLDSALAADDLEPMIAFFSSELGQRIVTLEVSAREAFLEEGVEEMSRTAFAALEADGADRAERLKALINAADLIESNVVGAMNSNFACYRGLAEGGGLPGDMSEEEMLADVWGQEGEIRSDTTDWLYAYFNLAYRPLDDGELASYIEFYLSDAGQSLNSAMFAAFDEMFGDISYALGKAAAQMMAGQEL